MSDEPGYPNSEVLPGMSLHPLDAGGHMGRLAGQIFTGLDGAEADPGSA